MYSGLMGVSGCRAVAGYLATNATAAYVVHLPGVFFYIYRLWQESTRCLPLCLFDSIFYC